MKKKGGSSTGGGSTGGGSTGGSGSSSDKDVVVLNDDNFDEKVFESDDAWLVEFYGKSKFYLIKNNNYYLLFLIK